jgi:hypothetical protein
MCKVKELCFPSHGLFKTILPSSPFHSMFPAGLPYASSSSRQAADTISGSHTSSRRLPANHPWIQENAPGCDALTGFGRPRQPHAVVYWIDTEISVLTPALSWLYSCVRACAWRHSRRSATWLDRAAPPRAQQAPLSTRAAHCTQNLGEGYIYKFKNRQRIGLPLVIWWFTYSGNLLKVDGVVPECGLSMTDLLSQGSFSLSLPSMWGDNSSSCSIKAGLQAANSKIFAMCLCKNP